jgi:glycosyltransferase involved in cell wall biosynthesis
VKHPLTYREAMSMGRIKTRRVISEEAEKWGKVIRVSCKQSLPLLGSTKCTKTLKLDSAS